MKRILILILCLCMCASLSACGRSDAPPEAGPDEPEAVADKVTVEDAQLFRDEQLTEAELALLEEEYTDEALTSTRFSYDDFMSDFDQLWSALDSTYPYFTVLADRNIDTAGIRETNRARAEAVLSLPAFVRLLTSMLSQMQNFAQLSVAGEDVYRQYASMDLGEQEELRPWITAVSHPQTQACYELLYGPADEYEPPDPAGYPAISTRYFDDTKTAYFSFTSFDPAIVDRDATIVAGFLSIHPDAENIIFDITGVNGGSAEYWQKNILAPFGGEYQWDCDLFLRDTPITRTFYGITAGYTHVTSMPEGAAIPLFAEDLGLTHYISASRRYSFEDYAGTQTSSDARRWVLTDNRVYAAADAFAAFCKATGWATVVGRQTMGDGVGLEPVLLSLNHTGLLIQFSALVAANDDGNINADAGTVPDYLSRAGETPLDACLRLIQEGGR